MQDEAIHLPRTVNRNPNGEEIATYADGDPWRCGFDPKGGKELSSNIAGKTASSADLIVTDASLRLPLAASGISPYDRMRLVALKGDALAVPQTFDVIGFPELGPSGIVLNLQRVET